MSAPLHLVQIPLGVAVTRSHQTFGLRSTNSDPERCSRRRGDGEFHTVPVTPRVKRLTRKSFPYAAPGVNTTE